MKNLLTISCPVSQQKVNENTIRILAILVAILVPIALLTGNYLLSTWLLLDFSSRAFFRGRASILKYISKQISFFLAAEPKLVDAAPKKFAAALGVIFCAALSLLLALKMTTAAWIVGSLLMLCAALEGFAGYCVGCVIYSLLKPLRSEEN